MSFIDEICKRELFYQCTDLDALKSSMLSKQIYGYIGFDVTADSLHVGHLSQIYRLRLLQKHGHVPIVLIGSGTTKIGDPSDRVASRPILTDEQIAHNTVGIKKCLEKFINFNGKDKALIVDNGLWLNTINYMEFLHKVGRYFSVNRMISFDSVKNRLKDGNSLSFLEMNYMLLQAYDFLMLYKQYGCSLQMGGSDQWSNIICGIELVKKTYDENVFGLTCPLLTSASGEKMGKTSDGAVWLDENKYSSYSYWQYWRNVDDRDVLKFLTMFTDIDTEEFNDGSEKNINNAKIALSDYMTEITHGKDAVEQAHKHANVFFFGHSVQDISPDFQFTKSDLLQKTIVDILIECNLSTTKTSARQLISGGGVYINNATIDCDRFISNNDIVDNIIQIRRGKKQSVIIKCVI